MINLKSWAVVPVFVASLLIGSCGSDEPDDPNKNPNQKPVSITVEPGDAMTLSNEAQTTVITVTSTADWSIASDAEWCTLSPRGGVRDEPTNVRVTVKANADMEQRVANLTVKSGATTKNITVTQSPVFKIVTSVSKLAFGGQGASQKFTVEANLDWKVVSDADWCTVSPAEGGTGTTQVTVTVAENQTAADRTAHITVGATGADCFCKLDVTQMSDAINTPEGYTLVWHDEFNDGPALGSDWVAENWPAGYVNNELQTYTSKLVDGKSTLLVEDGFLNINCFKGSDGKIYSGRVNARPSTGWLYGYFEARINLPSGRGTWPAYWMMPCNVDWSTNGWPRCGEIDIMEEVGANPNYVSSSLHTENYNHTKGTQKTHEMYCAGAEGSFHIYALEWTEDEIITYVDGKVQLRVSRASMGTDHASWPFHYAFYPILNLAWGGDWGGYKGVDDNALPVTMKIDYVRIFQKN